MRLVPPEFNLFNPQISQSETVAGKLNCCTKTKVKATFSCGLRFPLPLPFPLKANLGVAKSE
jgi:hypothetical protein